MHGRDRPGAVATSSIFLLDMANSKLPVAVVHGKGRVEFHESEQRAQLEAAGLVAVRYVDSAGVPTEVYTLNTRAGCGSGCAVHAAHAVHLVEDHL